MLLKCKDKAEAVRMSQRIKIKNTNRINLKKSNFERPPSNKFVEITMNSEEIKQILGGKISGKRILEKRKIDYPIGVYNYIDTAIRQKRATIASKVGKVHGMFRGRKFRSLSEYRRIYSSKFPQSIDNAVEEALEDFKRFGLPAKKRREYKKYVQFFVEELVIGRSYRGLKIQEVIFIKMADILKQDYRWGTNKEDSSGIDGFIGNIPISVKPNTCQQKKKAGVKRTYYTIDEKNSTLYFTFSL
jgi:hypothetical protein